MNSPSNNKKRAPVRSRRQEDLYYLKKAKKRIQSTLVLAYAMLCVWPLAVYFVLAQPLFPKPSYFNMLYLLVLLVELVVWLLIFFLASGGKKFSKALFTLALWCEFGFAGWLLYDMFRHMNFIPFYLGWFILAIIKDAFLVWLRGWLYSSWSGQIFFDHVLVLSEQDRIREKQLQRRRELEARARAQQNMLARNAAPSNGRAPSSNMQPWPQGQPAQPMRRANPQSVSSPNPISPNGAFTSAPMPMHTAPANSGQMVSREGPYKAPAPSNMVQSRPSLTGGAPDLQGDRLKEERNRLERQKEARRQLSSKYPRTAMRMAIGIYGELIVFPIVTHIMQNSFVSTDNSSVFAVGLMFTLCILTALVWTFPIFFYYLKYPGSKSSLWAACVGQLCIIGYEVMTLRSYSTSETTVYPSNVFLMFAIFEVVRYAILIITVFPAFLLPAIRDPLAPKKRFGSGSQDEEDEDAYDDEDSDLRFELYEDEEPDDENAQDGSDAAYDEDSYDEDYDDDYDGEDEDEDDSPLRRRWPFRS